MHSLLAVQQIEGATALGVADGQRRETVGWIDAPEPIGHAVGPAALARDLTEGDARLQPKVEAERVQDALDDGERR